MLANKKFLIVLAVLILSLSVLLCACDKEPNDPATDVTTTGSVEDATTADPGEQFVDPENYQIKVDETGKEVNIKIIRPDADDNKALSVIAAQQIREGMNSILGVAPKLDNDYLKAGNEHDAQALEILVGITNYDETAEVVSDIPSYGAYSIKIVNNKIVVVSYSSTGYARAANDLINLMRDSYDEATKTITLKASELDRTDIVDTQLENLPVFDGGEFKAYYDAGQRVTGKGCDEIIVSKATVEMYDAYIKKIEAAGYSKFATNDVNGNKFATYNSDKYTINAGFYDFEDSVRILIEPLAPTDHLVKKEYTKVTDSQITMLGLEHQKSDGSYTSNGLCTVIRLEDGRFVVVDGGFNRSDNATEFIKLIKDQSKAYTSTPTIAAWIITHAHGDHQGMIGNSTRANAIKNAGIKIESFMANFMSDAERTKSMSAYSGNWDNGEGGGYTNVFTTAGKFSSTMYKVHVGQKYYVADLEMEVLYTLESYAPKTCNALNTSSTVIKMTFGGKTTYLCTGDATGHGMELSAKTFGTHMQCDIVQVCHHGYTTWGNDSGMKTGYKTTNATLVLWPQGMKAFPNYTGKAYNSVLFTLSNYKECYVAGSMGDITIVKLPYVYGQSEIIGPHKYNG